MPEHSIRCDQAETFKNPSASKTFLARFSIRSASDLRIGMPFDTFLSVLYLKPNVSNISSLFLIVDNDVIRSAIEGSKQRIPLGIRSSPTDEFQPVHGRNLPARAVHRAIPAVPENRRRSEEHTSELQSLMRISYAVFCLKKKTIQTT